MIKHSLPTWLARVDTHALGTRIAERAASPQTVQYGPLTIFDPEGGCEMHQFGPDKSNVILFEGYLFDIDDWNIALESQNSHPTESELVSLAYERWGAKLFEHLKGAYLIAIWDSSNQRFIVGHDGLGKHPLYYVHQRGEFLFSSNIFMLADYETVSRDPNRMSFALQILGRWPLAEETFFKDIKRVRPGHYLELNSSRQLRKTQYWEPFPDEHEPWLPEEGIYEQFESMFTKSVGRCMQLGARGIMLSGGVDSVSVAAVASQYVDAHGLEPLIAYSGRNPPGYPSNYEDEMQDLVVDRLRMPHQKSSAADWLDGRDLLSATLDEVPCLPGPTDIWWTGGYMNFYRRAAKEGVTTLLTGSGGDEWLGVHPMYFADLTRRFTTKSIMNFLQAEQGTNDIPLKSIFSVYWNYGFRLWARSLVSKTVPALKIRYHLWNEKRRLPDWFCPDAQLKKELVDELVNMRIPELNNSGNTPASYYRHAFRFKWKNPLITYEFERRFHVNGLVGIKLLSPFHDRRLASFSARISPESLIHNNRYKGLLRPLTARYLPGLGLENQRKIYGPFEESFAAKELRSNLPLVDKQVGYDKIVKLGLVDKSLLDSSTQKYDSLTSGSLSKLFTALCAETWLNSNG